MNPEDRIIKKIQSELANARRDVQDEAGRVRLQEVLGNYKGEYELVWSDDLLKEIKERPVVSSHKLGLQSIDDVTGGFREQQLITLSAHSKHGKTAMSLFLMKQLEVLKPVLIPLEQNAEELLVQREQNGQFVPLFLSPRRNAAKVSVEWIEERVVEGIAKHGTRMVVIDHLGYINDFGDNSKYARENLAYRLQIVMQELKMLAKRWNVLIVLLCHIQQADEGKPPTLADLKGSSAILQESDKVLLLWIKNALKKKVRVYDTKVLLSVAANRQTGTRGNIGLNFNKQTGEYFEDNSWVEAMMKAAESEVAMDDEFDGV